MGMLQKIAMENKTGRQIGVFSVCTSNQLVIRAALRHAGKRGYPLVLEATSNQCNQFGGYTGMTPKDYMDMRATWHLTYCRMQTLLWRQPGARRSMPR